VCDVSRDVSIPEIVDEREPRMLWWWWCGGVVVWWCCSVRVDLRKIRLGYQSMVEMGIRGILECRGGGGVV
jgi:hypothetical protein